MTVVVNIVHFGHRVNGSQLWGVAMVFGAILMEVWMNYREKVREEERNKVDPDEQEVLRV